MTEDALQLSEATRRWKETFVSDLEVNAIIDYCLNAMRNHPRHKQGQAILLIGEAGSGKSAILRSISRRANEELARQGVNKKGAINADMPVPCTNRAISLAIRRSLGDPAKAGSATDNMDTARTLWEEFGTRLMSFDETHNIGEDKVDIAVSKRHFLKRLMNDFHGILVFAGTPALVPIIRGDPELRRRCLRRQFIPDYDMRKREHRLVIRKYLNALDSATGMPQRADLSASRRAMQIAKATSARRGIIFDFIDYARTLALEEGATQITDSHLSQAFVEFIDQGDNVANPFDDERLI